MSSPIFILKAPTSILVGAFLLGDITEKLIRPGGADGTPTHAEQEYCASGG